MALDGDDLTLFIDVVVPNPPVQAVSVDVQVVEQTPVVVDVETTQGVPGPQGEPGIAGADGPQGEPGVTLTGGMTQAYMFGTTTTAPPPSGTFRLNDADQTAATILWLHFINGDGIDIENYASQRLRAHDTIYIQDRNDAARWQLYEVTAAIINSGAYATIPVAWQAGGSSLLAQQVILSRETGTPLVAITVGPTPPSSPAINDIWIDTT